MPSSFAPTTFPILVRYGPTQHADAICEFLAPSKTAINIHPDAAVSSEHDARLSLVTVCKVNKVN